MIGLKRVDHISFAAWSVDEQVAWFEKLMGLKVAGRWRNEAEGYAGVLLDLPNNQMQLEIMEPIGEDSFVAKFLRSRGPGFHHVTVEVEDVRKAADELRANGIEPFGGLHNDGQWLLTYIHPSAGNGALWQIFEPLTVSEQQSPSA